MPTPRSWCRWRAAVPALLLCAEAAAQGRPLPPCAGTQQERWHECVGAFEDRRSGVTYHGEFRNGTMHGVGVLRTPMTTYAGDFFEGRMHGQGVLTMLEDRRQYSGGFRNGLMHGSGSIVAADGRVLATGRFQDGIFAAPSTSPLAAGNPAPATMAAAPLAPPARAQAPDGAGLTTSTADPPRAGATTTSTLGGASTAGTTVTTMSTGTMGAAGPPAPLAPPAPARPQAAASPAKPIAPQAPVAAPAFAAPQGLYLVRRGQVSLAELDVWYFAAGRVAQSPRAATTGAPAAFDFARAEAQRPGSTGAFVLDGARMVLSGPALPLTAARVDPAASGCFRWSEGLYCPAPRFAAGARLDGVFANPSAPGGTVARAAFKADGSYEIARGTANRGAPPARERERERGRYEIDGNVLRLRPAGGGAPAALTVVPYDDGTPGPAPRRLFLGGAVLGRQ